MQPLLFVLWLSVTAVASELEQEKTILFEK